MDTIRRVEQWNGQSPDVLVDVSLVFAIRHERTSERAGLYNSPSLDPPVLAAVKQCGWRNLCTATERDGERMFVAAYKHLQR